MTLYTLREVISILGEKEFGLYNVVFGIVAMFAFINSAMMSATQRFLSISIGRNKTNGVRNTFYGSLLIHLVLAVLVGIFIYLLKDYFLNKVLNINGYYNKLIELFDHMVREKFLQERSRNVFYVDDNYEQLIHKMLGFVAPAIKTY